MQQESIVSMNQMKDALAKMAGSRFPVKMTLSSGDVLVRYVRGFADQQSNIVLTSDTSYSIAMKITEVKDIAILEFAQEKSNGGWVTLHAKWRRKPEKT